MPYLIDGHNLIPKLPGMSLQAIDDEQELITLLQEFCRLRRKQVDVYFDNAPPGQMAVRKYGSVTAHFVRSGQTADAAIRSKLERLGAAARNWVVVSSDLMVLRSAKAARAHSLTSEAFAREVDQSFEASNPDPGEESEAGLSPQEVDDWLQMFTRKKPKP